MKLFAIFMTGLICAIQLYSFSSRYLAPSITRTNNALKIATYIKNNSNSNDRLLTVRCDDWSSQLFYLSGLKGLAVRNLSPEKRQSLKTEVKKMINNQTQSIFIIEDTEVLEKKSLSYLPTINKQSCNVIYKAGNYNAYKCSLEPFKIPTVAYQ